jgi:hypothetical protein
LCGSGDGSVAPDVYAPTGIALCRRRRWQPTGCFKGNGVGDIGETGAGLAAVESDSGDADAAEERFSDSGEVRVAIIYPQGATGLW